jgi:hypothetical protein
VVWLQRYLHGIQEEELTTKKTADEAEPEIQAVIGKGIVIEARDMPRKNLIQKLCEVIAELGPMKPEGFNSFHKYRYYSDEQLSSAFRDKLAKRNILLVPEVTSWDIRDFKTEKDKHSFLTTMMVRWTLHDGDSGELVEAVTMGRETTRGTRVPTRR